MTDPRHGEGKPNSDGSPAIPLRRAVAGETTHRHFRNDGRGVTEHQHGVRSERHGHPAEGLALVRLRWIGFSWTRAAGSIVHVGTVGVYVGFALMWLIGAWYFTAAIGH